MLKTVIKNIPFILDIYRWLRNKKIIYMSPKPLVGTDFKMRGYNVMTSGNFEKYETEYIRYLLSSKRLFINVGANYGYYILHSSHLGCKSIAVEPNPLNLNILMKNLLTNKLHEKVKIFPIALSDNTSILKLYGNGTSASLTRGMANQFTGSYVPIHTFDDVFSELDPQYEILILIDVEGAEISLIEGAKNSIERLKNATWIVEVNLYQMNLSTDTERSYIKSMFNTFLKHGYFCNTFDQKRIDITVQNLDQILDDYRRDKLSTHNFIFTRAKE